MAVACDFARLDGEERRHDGPILPPDPAVRPDGAARERLFRRLAGDQREDLARVRRGMKAAALAGNRILIRGQGRLRFYRDQGAAWATPRIQPR